MAYRLGLVSVSFRNRSPEEILQAMNHTSLTCIEWGSDIHAPCEDTDRLKQLATLQKNYGIDCCSYGTYFRLGVTHTEELPGYIQAAKILGTDILRLWCGNKNSELYTETEKEALFANCRAAALLAGQAGVTLCMECHNHTYTNRPGAALEVMEAVASPNFRMYWQPNQYRTEEENVEYARLLAPYTRHIHVFHWREKERFYLENGISLWRQYLSCFTGPRTLLLEFMPDDALSTLSREARALERIVK